MLLSCYKLLQKYIAPGRKKTCTLLKRAYNSLHGMTKRISEIPLNQPDPLEIYYGQYRQSC